MIDPYRLYYQESIKRSFATGNNNNPTPFEDGSPNHSRKKKGDSEQLNGMTHQDMISASLKTPPPTPSPPPSSSITTAPSPRRNIVKSLNKKPSMTKRLEKTARMPKTKAVKASINSSQQHQRQPSHTRRHYKEKRPSSITKSTARSRKVPFSPSATPGLPPAPPAVNPSLRHSYSMKSLNRAISPSPPPPFDKDILDTFCFHWPAMHCYVLVRILPRSIAILPIRTRLAFLYFCHAPRPRQPSLQDLHQQQLHGRRIQSMFKSWKHTLAFNDSSSSSSTSSDDDNDDSHNDRDDQHNTINSQGLYVHGNPTKKDQLQQQQQSLLARKQEKHATQLNDHNQHRHHSHDHHTPQHPPHHYLRQHHYHHHQRSSHHHPSSHRPREQRKSTTTTHRHTSSQDSSTTKHRRRHPHSVLEDSGDDDGNDTIDYYSKEGNAVTLSDVLKDHRTGDVCWIHAPCKIQRSSTTSNNSNNNFVTLQSKRTTLELKARCYSEKKMFINLFQLNRLLVSRRKKSRGRSSKQQQDRPIEETDLIHALETQNDSLQSQVSQLAKQMEQWQQDILYYEEKCSVLDDKLDMTMAAVQHHKEQHVDYEELTETMVGTRHELKSHMADFHKTHQRILDQHAGNAGGSFTWVIEKSFQRLHHFQDRHSTQNSPTTFYAISLVTGLIVLLLAVYIGFTYHS